MPWPGHPQRQRVDAFLPQHVGDGPHAVRRVGQAVDEQRTRANRWLGFVSNERFQSRPALDGCERLPGW